MKLALITDILLKIQVFEGFDGIRVLDYYLLFLVYVVGIHVVNPVSCFIKSALYWIVTFLGEFFAAERWR
jgi:hypothetical protein